MDLGGVEYIDAVWPTDQGGLGGRLIVGEEAPVFVGVEYLGTWKSQDEIDAFGQSGQDIGVSYTDWTYGGVSLAIIEDRKFKTAPDNALPFKVVNGFPQDPDVDLSRYYDADAELLGERQHRFLEQWVSDLTN